MGGKAWFLLLALSGAALDLFTKDLVFRRLRHHAETNPHPSREVVPAFFRLTSVENRGGMWGIGADHGKLLAGLRAVAVLAIAGFVLRLRGHRFLHAALGLIFAGALGNLWDSFFNEGKVRDFLDLYVGSAHWPAFNVADALICAGSGLLLLQMVTERRETPASAVKGRKLEEAGS